MFKKEKQTKKRTTCKDNWRRFNIFNDYAYTILGHVHTNPDIFWNPHFLTWIHVDGLLNCSGERFQNNAVSRTRFTGFVWTEGRFVKKSLRFHKYQASRGLYLKKVFYYANKQKKILSKRLIYYANIITLMNSSAVDNKTFHICDLNE